MLFSIMHLKRFSNRDAPCLVYFCLKKVDLIILDHFNENRVFYKNTHLKWNAGLN